MLGIGAAWYEREHLALGVPYPPVAERFERLEEALQICEQMWSDDEGPYNGKYYQLAETICVPRPLQTPRPPILIGGGGEKKTLRLVAQYADACNLFATSPEEIKRKLDILRGHCDAVGRDYDSIQKTIIGRVDPDGRRQRVPVRHGAVRRPRRRPGRGRAGDARPGQVRYPARREGRPAAGVDRLIAARWVSGPRSVPQTGEGRGFRAPAAIPERMVRLASSSGSPARAAASARPVITGSGGISPAATSWPRLNAARLRVSFLVPTGASATRRVSSRKAARA